MSKVMQAQARKGDTVARLFGSEFVLLMPNTDYNSAVVVAKSIHQKMDKLPTSGLNISCSVGVTHFKNDTTHEAFILRCEKLMEEAKELGGDRVISRI
jgi:diguanylate cyclase (GGDEF)-like protein